MFFPPNFPSLSEAGCGDDLYVFRSYIFFPPRHGVRERDLTLEYNGCLTPRPPEPGGGEGREVGGAAEGCEGRLGGWRYIRALRFTDFGCPKTGLPGTLGQLSDSLLLSTKNARLPVRKPYKTRSLMMENSSQKVAGIRDREK